MAIRIPFQKYQATGNDFVLIDNRSGKFTLDKTQVKAICDRKFGIGADGLMLIEKHPSADFKLQYFNNDGSQSLCGNGCRAAVHMASFLGMMNGKTRFQAFDGEHAAEILPSGIVRLKMNDVTDVRKNNGDYVVQTGSPHVVRFVEDVKEYPVVNTGRAIRYSETYMPAGINVNFVELLGGNSIYVRTYERGVEDETLSCGTGITAAAIAASFKGISSPVSIKTKGGDLVVEYSFNPDNTTGFGPQSTGQPGTFEEIYLIGPAKFVFQGEMEL